MKRGLTLARAKSPTSPAKGLRRLLHRLPALRGPEESDVLVHGGRRRWDRLNSNTSETAAHVVIGRPHGLRLGFRDNLFPATPIASVRLCRQHKPDSGGRAEHVPLCPGVSDINLVRYCQGIIYFNAQISDGAFDLGVAK